ncbi:MAG: aspartate dehydrogenase [Methanobacteriaceae archaeon]
MRIGILGCGAIANIIVNYAIEENMGIEFKYFYDNDIERAENIASISNGVAVFNIEEMFDDVDLILEAAAPSAIAKFGIEILENNKNLIIMSVGALMDFEFKEKLIEAASKHGSKIYVPSGAIVGLDGIKAASIGNIKKASLITRKPPKSLGRTSDCEEVLFEGKASEAVKKFPLNINVAAALSIACDMDVDVKIIVDPNVDRNVHDVVVEGDFGEFKTTTKNLRCSLNPKTSVLAAYSAIKLLKGLNENFIIGT